MASFSRFSEASPEEIELLKTATINQNTTKSTTNWLKIFKKWASARKFDENIENYEVGALDETLQLFYAELRREDKEDYEPGSLKVMQACLDRYLKEHDYPKSIIKDREFLSSQKVLEGKARKLRLAGKGKLPNRARSLTMEEEEVLWKCGQLGVETPRAMINTLWWLLTQHLGLRGRQEHHEMKVEDFTLDRDNLGNEFITFAEGPTKTRQGGLRVKQRLVTPKMFAFGGPRCPVNIFKSYLQRRPEGMKKTGPFYLAVIDHPSSDVWFKKSRMGQNTINNIMKTMKQNSPLATTSAERKLVNHSARKTTVRKMKAGGIPKSEIVNVTGHTHESGLDPYDSGNEEEQRNISLVIDGKRQRLHGNESSNRSPLIEVATSTNCLPVAPVFNFNNCQVVFNQNYGEKK